MMSRRVRPSFRPSLDALPSRIAPTVFTPPPPLPMDINAPPVFLLNPPTTLAVPNETDMTAPSCQL